MTSALLIPSVFRDVMSAISVFMPVHQTVKSEAMRLVDALPDDATWDDVVVRFYVRQCVDAGIADADAGRVLDVAEVRRKFGLQS